MVINTYEFTNPSDPNLWSNIDDPSYPGPGWMSIDLPEVGNMFQARVLLSGTAEIPVPLSVRLSLI